MSINDDRGVKISGRAVTIAAALLIASVAGTTSALAQNSAPVRQDRPSPYNVPPAPRGLPAAAPAPAPSDADAEVLVRVDENMIVDLHVSDEELGTVLEMLSLQSQKNIIASKNVSARVTANLYGVTFYEALDAILNINGYGYVEQGNFVMIYTLDELQKMEQASRRRVSKVLTLNFLNATDAAGFVTPLLSTGEGGAIAGQIKTNGKTGSFPSMGDVPLGSEEYAHTSMLVIYDYEENVTEIEALIALIDTRPAQVLVEATILQTSLNEANAFGVDFSLIADMDFGDFVGFGGPLQATNALINGRTAPGGSNPLPIDGDGRSLVSNVGNTAGPGGLKIGVVSDDVAIFMRVLDEVTDTTILSNPKILTLNRQPARVLVGRKVGYLSTTSTDTSTTQTVQFLDTGTQLSFRPFITNDGLIRMELRPQVSEAVIRDANDATGAAVTIPDEITNELMTNVIVRDGQTIVLGGLFRESTESSRRQVPLLGDIPVIGAAFRGNDDTTERSEIIFLVTPTIMNDTALATGGARAKDYVARTRAGAREGVLPFSRDRLTTMLNLEADDMARAGNTERALWLTQRSLALNSNQPEVIGLREKIATNKTEWPERSMLSRILKGESETIIRRVGQAPGNDSLPNIIAGTAPDGTFSTTTEPAASTTFTTPSNTEAAPFVDPNTNSQNNTGGEPVQPFDEPATQPFNEPANTPAPAPTTEPVGQNNLENNNNNNNQNNDQSNDQGNDQSMDEPTDPNAMSGITTILVDGTAIAATSATPANSTARLFFGNGSVLSNFHGFVQAMGDAGRNSWQTPATSTFTQVGEGFDPAK